MVLSFTCRLKIEENHTNRTLRLVTLRKHMRYRIRKKDRPYTRSVTNQKKIEETFSWRPVGLCLYLWRNSFKLSTTVEYARPVYSHSIGCGH